MKGLTPRRVFSGSGRRICSVSSAAISDREAMTTSFRAEGATGQHNMRACRPTLNSASGDFAMRFARAHFGEWYAGYRANAVGIVPSVVDTDRLFRYG